jgi:hypothetical protein
MDRHVPGDGGDGAETGGHGGGDAGWNHTDTDDDRSFGGPLDVGRYSETNPYASS